jgi:Dolichyl-phosphate-mannose-protein mannosyltransferase
VSSPAAILFAVIFTLAACCGIGRVLLRRLRIELELLEERLLSFVLGSAVLSLLVFLLAVTGLVNRLSLALLCTASVAGLFPRRIQGVRKPWPYQAFAALLALPFTVLYLAQALGPEYSPDGSDYHLALAAQYLRQGGFGHITPSIYASLSQGLEMLFVVAFAFGRHSAAAGVHFAYLVALVCGMLSYARRFGFPRAGICAALLVYLSPVVGFDGTAAYNDVATGCVVFFVFYLLELWDERRNAGLLAAAGLLAGFAFAIKYTAFVAVIYAIGYIAWRSRRMRAAALAAACAAVMMAPWMAKNWVTAANPVSPFLNRWFPNPYTNLACEQDLARGNGLHRDGFSLAGSATDMTIRGHLSRGLLGPAFLLAPIALLTLRWPKGRRLLLAAGVFASVWPANVDTRFLIPAVPFLALAMGLVLERVRAAIPLVLLAHAYLSWPTVVQRYCDPLAMRVRRFAPKEALRITPEEETLRYRLPGYTIARALDNHTPPDARVLALSTPPRSYTSREVLVWWASSFNEAARDVLLMPLRTETQPLWRWRFDFPRRQLRAVRFVQTARDPAVQWSIGEIHIRARPQAHPNPWDAGWARDGNPVTRWRSLEPMATGMHFDLDFDAPRELDSITLDCAHDQWSLRLRLEGQDADGRWQTIAAAPSKSEVAPLEGLRRMAARELAARGIRYLLLRDSDFGAADFRERTSEWSMRLLSTVEDWRLYAID